MNHCYNLGMCGWVTGNYNAIEHVHNGSELKC